MSKSGRVVGIGVALLVIVCAPLWYYIRENRLKDLAFRELIESAHILATYIEQNAGEWPSSPADLADAGLVKIAGPNEMVSCLTERVESITPGYGACGGIRINTNDIIFGWGGKPVDSGGRLLKVRAMDECNKVASRLSSQLREWARKQSEAGGHTTP